MVQVASKFVIMMGFWLGLSSQIDLGESGDRYLLACGVLSCAFVTYIAMRKKILDEEGHPIHLTFRCFFTCRGSFEKLSLPIWMSPTVSGTRNKKLLHA